MHTPPGPKGDPALGNTRQFTRDPLGFMEACRDAYRNLAWFSLGPYEGVLVTDPEAIEQVLVSDADAYRKPKFLSPLTDTIGEGLVLGNGSAWRAQRERSQAPFSLARIESFVETIARYADETAARWTPGETIDIHREMGTLTIRTIVELMFGVRFTGDQVDRLHDALAPLGHEMRASTSTFILPDWVPTPGRRRFDAALDDIHTLVEEVIEAYQAQSGATDIESPDRTDFLGVLLDAETRGEIDHDFLRSELVTILLAGYDTTALALTYSWYLLAGHPDVEQRFHTELDTVLDGRTPTLGHVRSLPYTERILREALRLYPPFYAIVRETTMPVTLCGYDLPADALVMLPQWAVHRDPRWYDAPTTFDPDRWAPDRAAARPSYAYFPFGGGPRICLGKHLAELEARLVLATIGQQFRLERASHQDESLEFGLATTLHTTDPIQMTVRDRSAT
jgi:cytochrome P450